MASLLFQKQLPVVIRSAGRDDRRAHISLTMEVERNPGLERGRTLVIRLTDENDLFFLHTLRMTYDDFLVLKDEERFLIDFDAFPRQIIDFLDLCIQEEFKHPPKYVLHLFMTASQAESRLDVVETNEFQHVTRLKLKMITADDSQIKKYLAECLKIARQEKLHSEVQTQASEKDFRLRLQYAEDALRKKTEDLEQLQSEWNMRSSGIHEKYSADMAKEREAAAAMLKVTQSRFEEERKNVETSATRTINKLEAKNYELQTMNKDLTEKKTRVDTGIQELRERINGLDDELQKRSTELQICKKQLNDSHARLRDGEHFKSAMDDQLRKHQESMASAQERLSSAQGQAEKLEKTLEQKDIQITRLQKDVQVQVTELNKANDIIRKMQSENRTISEKLKIRSSVVVQQETVLEEVKAQLEQLKTECTTLKDTVVKKEKEVSDLENHLSIEKANLADAEKSLENNANVIAWLNRQLNVVNGKCIQSLHPSTTVSSLVSRHADLNIPGSEPALSGNPGYHSSAGGVSSAASVTSGSARNPGDLLKASRLNGSERQRDAVVDEKYLQSPLSTKPSSTKFPNLTPTSALKSVASAYFT